MSLARKDRMGERAGRSKRQGRQIPEMGYYLIVADTEATERCYFDGLRKNLPENIQRKLVLKVVETKTKNLIQKCREMTAYEAQYMIPWIVFDRDEVMDFDQIIEDAEREGIQVGWSNPCFEIWMHAYFGSMPSVQESWNCCHRFGELYEKKTGHRYSKSDESIYNRLREYGDEGKAVTIAQQMYEQCVKNGYTKPSQMCPCTTVYELVKEIRGKEEIRKA